MTEGPERCEAEYERLNRTCEVLSSAGQEICRKRIAGVRLRIATESKVLSCSCSQRIWFYFTGQVRLCANVVAFDGLIRAGAEGKQVRKLRRRQGSR
jgi:hypothetical protein